MANHQYLVNKLVKKQDYNIKPLMCFIYWLVFDVQHRGLVTKECWMALEGQTFISVSTDNIYIYIAIEIQMAIQLKSVI